MKKFWLLLFALFVSYLPAFYAAHFSVHAEVMGAWYYNLSLPAFTPCGKIIAAVWIFLYTLLGFEFYYILILHHNNLNRTTADDRSNKKRLIWLFISHIFFNGFWIWLFFKKHLIGLAFINILILILIASFMFVSMKKDLEKVRILLIPYIAWLVFAGFLNFSIWVLN